MKTITHSPRLRNLIATAVFSALASGFSAVGAAADGDHAPTAIIRYGDLDVSTVQGATAPLIESKRALTTKIVGLEAAPPGGMPMEEISLSYQLMAWTPLLGNGIKTCQSGSAEQPLKTGRSVHDEHYDDRDRSRKGYLAGPWRR